MIKRPSEEFRIKHRIQLLEIPTTGTWQAFIYQGKRRYSERAKTRLEAIKKLAERLKLEGREKLWHAISS